MHMDEWDLDVLAPTVHLSTGKPAQAKPKAKSGEDNHAKARSKVKPEAYADKVKGAKDKPADQRKRKAVPPEGNTVAAKQRKKREPDLRVAKLVVAPTFNDELECPKRLSLGVDCAGMIPEALALDDLRIKYKIQFASEQDPVKRKLIEHMQGPT